MLVLIFSPPGFSNVQVTNLYSQAVITWNTTEPATAFIRFGTNRTALDRSLTNAFAETEQSFTLAGLATEVTWWFELICTDEAGKPRTTTMPGSCFLSCCRVARLYCWLTLLPMKSSRWEHHRSQATLRPGSIRHSLPGLECRKQSAANGGCPFRLPCGDLAGARAIWWLERHGAGVHFQLPG